MSRTAPTRAVTVCASLAAVTALSSCTSAPELDADQQRAQDVSTVFLTSVIDQDAAGACAVVAVDGTPLSEEPEWEKACVEGITESNTSSERRDLYRKQMDVGAEVSAVRDGRITVTWDAEGRAGADPTVHTLLQVDDTWYVTQ